MQYGLIKPIADRVLGELLPYCIRGEVAGSIRRQKAECKDIEIVIIPRLKDLQDLSIVVDKWERVKGFITGKYTQRVLPEGIKLDLFIANEKNWGNIFLIRTGDSDFCKDWMNIVNKKGYKQKDGYLYYIGLSCGDSEDLPLGDIISLKDEEDYFKILGISFIEPERRDKNALQRYK